jgi:polysaccharide chain length determinant protein (PEP-CTERM system associated)
MNEETAKKIDPRTYWRVLWRRKKLVLLPVLLVVGTAAVGSFFLTPIYRSTAVILVEENRPLARSLESILIERRRVGESQLSDLELEASTLETKVKNPAILRKVMDTLGLRPDSSAFASALNHTSGDSAEAQSMAEERLVEGIAKSISVKEKAPGVFDISVEWTDPDTVQEVARKVTDFFIEDALETHLKEMHSMYEFSVSQLSTYEQKLKESQEKLKRFKQEMALGTIEETPVDSNNIDDVNTLLANFLREYESLLDEVNSQYAQISHLAGGFVPTEHLRTLKNRLMGLSNELPSLLVRYEWTAPAVLTVNSRVNAIKESIRTEVQLIVEQRSGASYESKRLLVEYELSKIDADFLKNVINRLRALIGQYERKIVATPRQELELARLEQEVESNRQVYEMLLEQSKGANLSKALEYVKIETRYRIIEPPKRPRHPVKPRKAMIGGVALLIGVMLGLGLAFLSEYMDDSLKAVEDVQEYLELPILGTIPKISSGGTRWKR